MLKKLVGLTLVFSMLAISSFVFAQTKDKKEVFSADLVDIAEVKMREIEKGRKVQQSDSTYAVIRASSYFNNQVTELFDILNETLNKYKFWVVAAVLPLWGIFTALAFAGLRSILPSRRSSQQ